jgi:putative aldouronate transport system permease protein
MLNSKSAGTGIAQPLLKKTSAKHAGWKKTAALTTMVAPGAIWLLLLRYLPMFGIVLAFLDYKVYPKANTFLNNLIHSKWSGFKNFEFLFMTGGTWTMIRNTLAYNAVWIVLGMVISVSFAIMLSQLTRRFMAKTYQTLMFFPYFLSWVVASYFLLAFLDATNGMIPRLQRTMGAEAIDWYNTPGYWPFILTFANLWKNTGYAAVLYLAAITGIDTTQYEAAAVDGASKWQQVVHVTLPNIRTVIIVLFIMNVGRIFNADFGLFYQVPLNSGPLFPATQVIDTYVYRALASTGDIGMSAAAGLLQNVVGFICILGANAIVRKLDADSSLF